MLFVLCYSLVAILINPASTYTPTSVVISEINSKFVDDTEEKDNKLLGQTTDTPSTVLDENQRNYASDKTNYLAEEMEESNKSSERGRTEASNDLFNENHIPITKLSTDNFELKQHEDGYIDTTQELYSQGHETEFQESNGIDLNRPERDFISPSPNNIELKPTPLAYTGRKLEKQSSSEKLKGSSIPENHHQRETGRNIVQHFDLEETQISENKLNKLEDGQTERSYSEVNKETQLYVTDTMFPRELTSTDELKSIEPAETDAKFNEASLEVTKGYLTHKMANDTDLNNGSNAETIELSEETHLKQAAENFSLEWSSTNVLNSIDMVDTKRDINGETFVETREPFTSDSIDLNSGQHLEEENDIEFSENTQTQTGENVTYESVDIPEIEPVQQEHNPISQNVLSESSHIIKDDIKTNVGRDVSENSFSVTKVNQDDMINLEYKHFDRIPDHKEEWNFSIKPTDKNSEDELVDDNGLYYDIQLPKETASVKENSIPSSDANLEGNFEQSENLPERNIDSEYTANIALFTSESENEYTAETPEQPDSVSSVNYPSEQDNLKQSNIESLLKGLHNETDGIEVKENERNQRELIACEIAGCSDIDAFTNHEIADFRSELIPKIRKDRNRTVERDLESAIGFKLIQNGSAREEGAFEYLENIEFNLHEVIEIIKTDSNVRAFIFNSIILYGPVLICDVLLWIVIVKLIRHIRRQIVSNQHQNSSEISDSQQNESQDIDKPLRSGINPDAKSKISSKDSGGDTSSEVSMQKVWYPPS